MDPAPTSRDSLELPLEITSASNVMAPGSLLMCLRDEAAIAPLSLKTEDSIPPSSQGSPMLGIDAVCRIEDSPIMVDNLEVVSAPQGIHSEVVR